MLNRSLVRFLLLTLPLFNLVGSWYQVVEAAQQPNLLILFPDQWRRQAFSCYGDPNVKTPNIDRLAAQGVRFNRCYATNPVCSPARAIFLTSRYGHQTGLIQNSLFLPSQETTFPEVLASSGYTTGYIGKWHLDGPAKPGFVPPLRRQGYQWFEGFNRGHWFPQGARYFTNQGKLTNPKVFESIYQTDLAIDFMKQQKTKPFLLFVSYGTPHTPYRPPARYDRFKPAELAWRPNVPEKIRKSQIYSKHLGGYYGLCELLDHETGRLMAFLDESGLAKNTVVMITSDHGDAHGSHGLHHKGQPEEESLGIPWIIRGPGVKPGVVTETLAGTIDFAPTLLSLCRADIPDRMVGRNLTPALAGKEMKVPWVYTQGRMTTAPQRPQTEGNVNARRNIQAAWRALVTPRYKLAVDNRENVRLLIDLEKDRYEMNNLANEPEHAALQERLWKQLRSIGQQTRDPFPNPVARAPARPLSKATGPASAARQVSQTVAHRGASSERPENTLAAFQRAIDVGATATEVDVQTSQDGKLFLLHDSTLDRTTSGKGKATELTLAKLKQLDAGSWFDAKYREERIPTLAEALKLCRGKIDVLLDLKEQGESYAKQVADEVGQFGDPKKTIVGVRSVEQAKLFRRLLPEARQLGLIPGPEAIPAFAEAGVEMIRLWPRWLEDKTLVPQVKKAGVKLHLNGTTGLTSEALLLLPYQPDSISADDPGRLIKSLREIAGSKR